MTAPHDRRSIPATDRVALEQLRDTLDRPAYTKGQTAFVSAPVTDICDTPDGARDRQMLMGTMVTVIDRQGGWAFIQDENLYCGWAQADALDTAAPKPTHRVAMPATQVYPSADFKQRAAATLSLGARLAVAGTKGEWARLADGRFVPAAHLDAAPADDAATVASLLIGTPYVWGGNSRDGIDCSGLVQLSLNACGRQCPGDSDMQRGIGHAATGGYRRGDLLFWPGHVAMALDGENMIHATAYGMTVMAEPIATARHRIEASGKVPLLTVRRL